MKKKQVKRNNKTAIKNRKLTMDIISEYSETFRALDEHDKRDVCLQCEAKKIIKIIN